jgi:hypothetical protein
MATTLEQTSADRAALISAHPPQRSTRKQNDKDRGSYRGGEPLEDDGGRRFWRQNAVLDRY